MENQLRCGRATKDKTFEASTTTSADRSVGMRTLGVDRERRPLLRKIFEIRKRKKCSLHYRKIKPESFYDHDGKRLVRIKKSPETATTEEFELVAGDCMRPDLAGTSDGSARRRRAV